MNNAITKADYEWAVAEARSMGLDPDDIPHGKPTFGR